jgi:hypothetical protein
MGEIVENTGRIVCNLISNWNLPIFGSRCLTYPGTIEVGGIVLAVLGLLGAGFLLYLLNNLVSVKV